MWIMANPNPGRKLVPDCVIRALCIALQLPWLYVFDALYEVARMDYSMPSDDNVWGHLLYLWGFRPFLLNLEVWGKPPTIRDFARFYPEGTYIIGTGSHAVAVVDGNYYDTWDSGDETPSFFWVI